jgi:hypothetical protein
MHLSCVVGSIYKVLLPVMVCLQGSWLGGRSIPQTGPCTQTVLLSKYLLVARMMAYEELLSTPPTPAIFKEDIPLITDW